MAVARVFTLWELVGIIALMDGYSFSTGSFILGILIVVAGVLLVKYYKQVADNMGKGMASYERYKLYGTIACGVGILVMLNVHMFVLGVIVKMVFGGALKN